MKKLVIWLPAMLGAAVVAGGFFSRYPSKIVNIEQFAALPVLQGGRVKPLDTLARTSLMVIHGKQSLRRGQKKILAIEWLLDVIARPELADKDKIFLIHDPDILSIIGKTQENGKDYSFADLAPFLNEIDNQTTRAEAIDSQKRTRFQGAIVNLAGRISLYQRLKNTIQLEGAEDFPAELEAYQAALGPGLIAIQSHMKSTKFDQKALDALQKFFTSYSFLAQTSYFKNLPPLTGEDPDAWVNTGESLLGALRSEGWHPGAAPYAAMAWAWRYDRFSEFNQALGKLRMWIDSAHSQILKTARYEVIFNRVEPFYQGMILYVAVFFMVLISWFAKPEALKQAAWRLLIIAFVVHTAGLAARIFIQGRPPVTNLYSSAVFVGWVAVLFGVILEKIYRNSLGSGVASLVGFATLIIAHHLAISQGDTMEMMRAVLDSNFWLATHVITITIGYGLMFLAGGLAHVYILRGRLAAAFDLSAREPLVRMTYAVVGLSLFFSFVGTILGGIWADQSWGRFWGWDPKENGALLIVLWNALILHARWGGYIKERGLMLMAVGGNIVTSLSWFGVNMLGIGLHSYGFMDKAFFWLAAFITSQIIVILMGSIPLNKWRGLRGAE